MLMFSDFSSEEESESSLGTLRKDSWRILRAKIDEETIDAVFSSKLRRHFEGQFRYDREGVPRLWKPGDDIDEAFKAAKKQVSISFLFLYRPLTNMWLNAILDPRFHPSLCRDQARELPARARLPNKYH